MSANGANGGNGDLRRYQLIRAYVGLVVGVGLIVYSLVGMIEPAILTFGGAVLGIDPMMRSTGR